MEKNPSYTFGMYLAELVNLVPIEKTTARTYAREILCEYLFQIFTALDKAEEYQGEEAVNAFLINYSRDS